MTRCSAVLFIVMMAQATWAQFPFTRIIDVRNGQQRPAIGQVVQDGQGLIWVGSDLGLLRTDGEQVEFMLRTEASGITALQASARGVIAALGTGTVVRCDALGCDTLWTGTAAGPVAVRALAEDAQGRIWIGTYGSGVLVLEQGQVRAIKGLPDQHVNDLCTIDNDRIVVATDQGIAVCSNGVVTEVFGESQGAPDNLVLCVVATLDGSVWAGTDRSGPFSWKPGSGAKGSVLLDPNWGSGPVRSICVMGDLVWAGTENQGVVMVDRGPSRGSYSSRAADEARVLAVRDLLLDRDGAVWWCDGTERLHRADPAILFVPEHEGLDLRGITALCSDAKDRIWFATQQGLFSHVAAFAEELRVTRTPVNIDRRTPIVSMATTSDGTLWAATFGEGVYAVRSDGSVRHYTAKDGLGNDNVLGARAQGDAVWFATLEGVSRFRDGAFTPMVHEAGFVFDVLPDGTGALMATDGHGVMRSGQSLATAPDTEPRTYYTLARDATGAAWAAGPGTGFCQVRDDGALRCVGADRPPFNGDLFSMGSCNGRLLAFGSTGVAAMDPKNDAWTDLTARFGLENMQAQLNALCTDRSGSLWLACDKGLVRMRPTERHFDARIPVVIIGVQADNEHFPAGAPMRTRYDRNDITIHFTGLNYADPGAVRFEYRLHGLDDRVIRTRDREVGFSALPPGDYRFDLRAFTGEAASPGDAWTSLEFTVEAPWWRWPWVVGTGALLVFIAVFSLLRARERRLRYHERMEQEQVRFQLEALRSQVDPHFLFNSFNALVEMIESDPHKAVEHVEQLSVFFRNILHVRDRERITVEEELELVRNYFSLEQRRFGPAIALEVSIGAEERSRGIVPLTLQLLVENALKHNVIEAKDPFIIRVYAEADEVVVANPMRPRLSPPRSTGFGLESITKRYSALTDRPIRVERGADQFTVRIPLIAPLP